MHAYCFLIGNNKQIGQKGHHLLQAEHTSCCIKDGIILFLF